MNVVNVRSELVRAIAAWQSWCDIWAPEPEFRWATWRWIVTCARGGRRPW